MSFLLSMFAAQMKMLLPDTLFVYTVYVLLTVYCYQHRPLRALVIEIVRAKARIGIQASRQSIMKKTSRITLLAGFKSLNLVQHLNCRGSKLFKEEFVLLIQD